MTVREASELLGRSEYTIQKWIREEKLPATKDGTAWDIPEIAVENFRRANRMRRANKPMLALINRGAAV